MKKLFTLLIFSFPFLCFAQTNIQGNWKLSPVKMLRLNTDQSFHLTKGAYHHYGTYEIVTEESAEILKLYFETVTIDYAIISNSADKLELMDLRNNEIINARRAPQEKTYGNEVVKSDPPSNKMESSTNPLFQNHYRNQYPDNQIYFSIAGFGGASWASGESVKSLNVEEGNVTEDFSTSFTYSYGGGLKLGYQFSDGFYFGSGASYMLSGFVANRKSSASDPEYQFDAESSQRAKYTYSSIEVPLWINYRFANKWMFELGGLASLPIRSTSKTIFQGENTVTVNGKIDERTSYTSDDYTHNYPNLLEDYTLGGYVEVQRRLAKHLSFSLSYKYVKDFMRFDNDPISNNIINASLILQLF